jgi:2-polyprenyl-3-methyl-5-hydroxy-6-metoxy-1,4-benzoquinol methylase
MAADERALMNERTCPGCGGTRNASYGRYHDEEYFTSNDSFEYWRCDGCGTVFLHPLPVQRLSEIYPANYYSFQSGGSSPLVRIKEWLDMRYFARVLRDVPGNELRVLDVGGGTGWLLDVVKKLDSRVRYTQVVDLDQTAGEQARAKGHAYACQRIEHFVSDQPFDLVLMLNLIEHVEAPRQVLANIASLLAPNGLLLIKTPNIDSWDARVFQGSYWAGLHVPRHWTLFTRPSFEAMLAGTGLTIRRFNYTQGAPFWAASLLATLSRMQWTKISRARPVVYHPLFQPLGALFAAFDLLRSPLARTSQMCFVLGKKD